MARSGWAPTVVLPGLIREGTHLGNLSQSSVGQARRINPSRSPTSSPPLERDLIATQGFGLKNLSAQGAWVHYASGNTQNLVDDTINALAYDGNNLWIATPSGLSVNRNGVFLGRF